MTDIPRPIILLGAPRSRTSLTAHIFHAHGCWVGNYKAGDNNNPNGYYENRDFKKAIVARAGRACVHEGYVCQPDPGWEGVARDVLRDTGYEGGPWIVKHSAMYHPLWHGMAPFFVTIRRGVEAIMASCAATGYLKSDEAIRAHVRVLDEVEENHGGHRLDTDRYFRGEWAQMDAVMSAAGLHFDRNIAEGVVDGSYNRFGG